MEDESGSDERVFPMSLILSREQVRRLDADAVSELGIPSLLLMENAARGAAEVVHRHGSWASITILCGPGNNGGDGLALSRLLACDGVDADTILIRASKELSADAKINLHLLQRTGGRVREIEVDAIERLLQTRTNSDLIVDALLGTGIRGDVKCPWQEIIRAINSSAAMVFSMDVPSGLDCDSGQPCGTAVAADLTVTFAAIKKGFLRPEARPFVGDVRLAHIGLPKNWLESWYLRISGSAR